MMIIMDHYCHKPSELGLICISLGTTLIYPLYVPFFITIIIPSYYHSLSLITIIITITYCYYHLSFSNMIHTYLLLYLLFRYFFPLTTSPAKRRSPRPTPSAAASAPWGTPTALPRFGAQSWRCRRWSAARRPRARRPRRRRRRCSWCWVEEFQWSWIFWGFPESWGVPPMG